MDTFSGWESVENWRDAHIHNGKPYSGVTRPRTYLERTIRPRRMLSTPGSREYRNMKMASSDMTASSLVVQALNKPILCFFRVTKFCLWTYFFVYIIHLINNRRLQFSDTQTFRTLTTFFSVSLNHNEFFTK